MAGNFTLFLMVTVVSGITFVTSKDDELNEKITRLK